MIHTARCWAVCKEKYRRLRSPHARVHVVLEGCSYRDCNGGSAELTGFMCSTTNVFVKTMVVAGQLAPVSKDLVGILIAGAAAGRRTATCAERPAAQDEPLSFLSRRQPSA